MASSRHSLSLGERSLDDPQCSALSEEAVMLDFPGEVGPALLDRILAVAVELESDPFDGFEEAIPGFTTLAVRFDAQRIGLREAVPAVRARAAAARGRGFEGREVEIPVCYGGEAGPDLAWVAEHCGLSEADVIELHHGPVYTVHLLGFAPGFPYLAGMDRRLAAPRLETPRVAIPAGSVGIAGEQTGIYPQASPGGWRLIGRTPIPLFDPEQVPPTRLLPGDRVRFRPISLADYHGSHEGATWESKSSGRDC